MRARRKRLGLSPDDVARAGGPSARTVRDIENNRIESITSVTMRALDVGLRWDIGTARDVNNVQIAVVPAVEAREVVEYQPEEPMDSTQWKAKRPNDMRFRDKAEAVTVLPRTVDNLAWAMVNAAELIASAIRYHGDAMVTAAQNRRTRGDE